MGIEAEDTRPVGGSARRSSNAVGGVRHDASVLTSSGLLAAFDAYRQPSPTVGSGLADLDSLTGGMQPGRVWVVTGAPGQGRTALLTQWAAAVAGQPGQTVHLVTPRESPARVGARLLALHGRLPLHRVASKTLVPAEAERLDEARTQVQRLGLSLYAEGENTYVPEVHPERGEPKPTAIVVDDADLVSGVSPSTVASWAEAGLSVLLSLPRDVVMTSPDDESDLDPAWARAADVVLEVRHRGLRDGHLRPGEADFCIHRNRWGPLRTLSTQYQGHFARFVEATS